jgi:hypothetical protein
MPDVPPDDLARARAVIEQLHERLGPLLDTLLPDADMAVKFDPEQPE